MDVAERFGGRLKKIRESRDLTQEVLAERMGVDASTISRIERGKRGWDALQTLADAMERAGLDPEDLFAPDWVEDQDAAEAARLFVAAPADVRRGILTMLRGLQGLTRSDRQSA